uniref:Putative disease resistance protein RGA3 n=1 Tax=Davidia involucrata TaxID=16924 RepID=A0A5B6YG60_DAVIN
MAEALVSVAFDRLTSLIQKVGSVIDVPEDVKKLSTTFAAINVMLEDAGKNQLSDDLVKILSEKLEDIAYDIDDVLDEWSTEIGKTQLDTAPARKRKLQFVLSSASSVITDWKQQNEIAGRIKDIRVRLDEIENKKPKFCSTSMRKINEPELPKTTSMVNPSEVFGRSVDKEIVTSTMLDGSEQEMGVISIVGLAGIGKTTLAQLAFNDDRVKGYFDKRIWVCVSENFDGTRIANAIIEQVEGNFPSFIEWEPLQQKLCSSIMGKRFLLVLDDVWNDDDKKWDSLKLPLSRGAPGSKILITTRKDGVARMVGSTKAHTLGLLSEEDCRSFFRAIAFSGKTREECESLEDIGGLIAKKCKGWPHAAKTIGILMRSKRTKQDWQNVLVDDRWNLPEIDEGKISAPLLTSYNNLPSLHLKRCFRYCAIFPKDCILEKDYVIKLWMANGLLGSEKGRDPEIIGGDCFDDLVNHSFFQDLEKDEQGNILSCKMHDSVHNFLRSLPMANCFVRDNEEQECSKGKARHLILPEKDEIPASIYNAKGLRTVINKWNERRLQTIPHDLFNNLQCLRAVDLSCNSILVIPSEVEKLTHLRFLDLSGGPFEQLPEGVINLYNLQTLKLIDCHNLCELPQGMENLVNLRHLEIDGTYSLTYLPRGVGKLTSLRTLSKFIVSNGSRGCQMEQLKDLNYLRGRLRIQGLGNVADARQAAAAVLTQKQHLRTLVLDFRVQGRGGEYNSEEQERVESVIEHLQPHQNLENLEILCYPGKRLPLFVCKLPYLEKLVIYRMNGVKCMGYELFGFTSTREMQVSFPKLKELKFHQMDEWELCDTLVNENDDNHSNNFVLAQSLRVLTLICCLKLKVLPHNLLPLTLLRELCICTCPNLTWTTLCLLLPHLEKLTLDGDAGVLSRSISSRHILLPNLRFLKISSSPHWSLPEGLGQFAELQSLEIFCCPHIMYMSEELRHLPMLQDLKIIHCPILGPRCQRNGADWHNISHILNIYVSLPKEREPSGTIVGEDT